MLHYSDFAKLCRYPRGVEIVLHQDQWDLACVEISSPDSLCCLGLPCCGLWRTVDMGDSILSRRSQLELRSAAGYPLWGLCFVPLALSGLTRKKSGSYPR